MAYWKALLKVSSIDPKHLGNELAKAYDIIDTLAEKLSVESKDLLERVDDLLQELEEANDRIDTLCESLETAS